MNGWKLRSRGRNARPVALSDVHRAQVEDRRAAVTRLLPPDSPAAARVAEAPAGYVLAHTSSDIARHCELLSDLPGHGQARVVTTPGRVPGEWRLDVASRDRPGLLAAFTGVLARMDIDVQQAVLATWEDGGALEAFVVTAIEAPEPGPLQDAFERSLDEPLTSAPISDAEVSFTNSGLGLYTSCDIRAADRPGLLHAIAVAIADAGADVHAARVSTTRGLAHDRFDLSDRSGDQLGPAMEEAIHHGVTLGVSGLSGGRINRRDRRTSHAVVDVGV